MLKKLDPPKVEDGGMGKVRDEDDDEFCEKDGLIMNFGKDLRYFIKFWMYTNEKTVNGNVEGNEALFDEAL